jgi:hypothetical protein
MVNKRVFRSFQLVWLQFNPMIENKSFTKKQNFWNSLLKQKVIFCWKITFSDFLVKIAKKKKKSNCERD